MKKQYSFRLDAKLIEALDQEAKKQNAGRTEILEQCISRLLLPNEMKQKVGNDTLLERLEALEQRFNMHLKNHV